MNFFDTQAGYDLATHTIPCLVRAIEEQNKIMLEHTRALRENAAVMKQYIALRGQEKQDSKNKEFEPSSLA
jgi:hypothetical protein